MVNRKKIRTRGKLQLSRYFKKFVTDEKVAVIKEKSIASNFPKVLQGRTGIIEEARGKAYLVKINDKNQEKRYLIEPIHLKKIK